MNAGACYPTWRDAELRERAEILDAHFPNCFCECAPLCSNDNSAVNSDELIARILTTPFSYDISAGQLVSQRLTALYSSGVSFVRQGASDDEIRHTINQLLTNNQDPQQLFGAVLCEASEIRSFCGEERWFGVYATEDGDKTHHVDLLGTTPVAESKTKVRIAKDTRRYALCGLLGEKLLRADTPEALIDALRAVGF